MTLIKLSGKPIEKLIEVISQGIGTLYKPTAIRREANSKAYEITVIERAKSKAKNEGKLIEADTLERIENRILSRELNRQDNIDSVVEIAAQQVYLSETVSDDSVNKDWTKRFFNIVEDISEKEMQQIWGKVLAGEVKQPGSFSLRTLELLRNMKRTDAETFLHISKYGIYSNDSNTYFVLDIFQQEKHRSQFDVHYRDKMLMEELGIFHANTATFTFFGTKQNGKKSYTSFSISNKIVIQELSPGIPKHIIDVYPLTKIGCELMKLVETEPSFDYITLFANQIRRNRCLIYYGEMQEKISIDNLTLI